MRTCQAQTKGVAKSEKIQPASKGTHELMSTDRGSGQGCDIKLVNEEDSLPVEDGVRESSVIAK